MFPLWSDSTPTPNSSQHRAGPRPILFVDVDGVISLFGFDGGGPPPGSLVAVEGIIHCIGHGLGERLAQLGERFELVWATGWEEKANEHLAGMLGIGPLPTLSFDGRARFGTAHWKLDAIDEYAREQPLAWVDDSLDERCERWGAARRSPTLLVRTEPATGLEDRHVADLLRFADSV